MNCIVRLATTADIDQLVPLRVLMQKEVHPQIAVDDERAFSELTRKYLFEVLPLGKVICCVAESAGQIVANTFLLVIDKAPSLNSGKSRIGYVSNVYTLPEFRGKGIGTAVMEELKRQALLAGMSKVMLNSTEAGSSVYERVGFKAPSYPAMELRL